MHLVLAVPGVLAQPRDALAPLRVLDRLASGAHVLAARDLDSALLHAFDIDLPIGPLAALGAGVDVGTRWFARADPVTMSLGQDDVRIRARVDDLSGDETRMLASLLAAHFADDDVAFAPARPDAWFASSARTFDLSATPVDAALDRPLRELLPSGGDAARWRRWLTEIQMLLHEHPLAGRAGDAVNALWLSHPGRLTDASRIPPLRVHATASRAADVARGLARLAKRDVLGVSLEDALAAREDALVVADLVATPQALERALAQYVTPALAALDAKRIDALDVALDGAGRAGLWRASRSGWLQRLRSRDTRFDASAALIRE